MPASKRKVRLNIKEFATRCDQRGWRTLSQRAAGTGISEATMSRLHGGSAASIHTVVGVLSAFGRDEFYSLFEVDA